MLSAAQLAGALLLIWPDAYALYGSSNLNGPYLLITGASPYTNLLAGPQEFFRLQSTR
jgi:hypothetical protein